MPDDFETADHEESAAEQLVHLLCAQFDAPCGLISLFGPDKSQFGAVVGLDVTGVETSISATRLLVEAGPEATLIVPDATMDPRFRDHPLVIGSTGLRFYAGAAVVNRSGSPVGSIAVMDTRPRPEGVCIARRAALKRFARLASELLSQAQIEREKSEQIQTLSLAESMAGIGHWRLDASTGRVAWSDEVYRIHGVERGEFDPTYDDAVDFYHPDDRPAVRTAVEQALNEGKPYSFRLRILRPDGEERIVLSQGAAELDARGRTASAFGVFQDVTETELDRKRLVENKMRYRLLADRATDVIAVYKLDGTFTYLSPAAEKVIGHAPDDLIGRKTWDLIHPDDAGAVYAAFEAYVADPEEVSPRIPYRAKSKDGRWLWLEAHPVVVRDEKGRPTHFQDTVRDITETKQLEAELIEARDTAEAAAQAKTEFLSNMSHELRTPLTSVIGFSGLLLGSDRLVGEDRLHVDRIATASDALLSVINDILDYSKLEANAVEIEAHPFSPRSLLDGAAAIIEPKCLADRIRLDIQLDESLPPFLLGDDGRVRQVVLNLLSNAVKFTPAGKVTLEARYEDDCLCVSVTDSGIGIGPDKLARLFERFAQADASTTRVYGGTGLGLSISKRLVDLMGGQIHVSSEVGVGSRFSFHIPLTVGSDEPAEVPADHGEAPQDLRVLVADDVQANRELVSAILASLGMTVDLATNGAEAVEAAQAGWYDVILMDVQMPVMDGLDAARAIRSLGGDLGRTPVIALTANIQSEQVQRCRDAGMDGHVGKPIQVADLLDTMSAVLSARAETDHVAA
ncbi:MAG: PAS domain S-box protein [Brevundimonas sp.]|nr:MAG: PAS domain S-box protein [Brevundimonas sp.]